MHFCVMAELSIIIHRSIDCCRHYGRRALHPISCSLCRDIVELLQHFAFPFHHQLLDSGIELLE